MRFQFAAGRQQVPFSSSNVAVASGGSNSTTRSLYLAIVGENPAGVNLLSSIVGPVAINPGQQLTVTFPTPVAGEFFEAYTLAASTTNEPTNFVQLAKVRLRSGGSPVTPPITLTLNSDDDLSLSATLATPASLPINPSHGSLRQITSLGGKIFEYDEYANAVPDSSNILSATVGAWIWKPGNFSAYVSSTTAGGGCDCPLDQVTTTPLRAPRYQPDGSTGPERLYWIVNNDDVAIPSGKRVGATVEVDGVPQGHNWDGLLKWRFLGYADISTGALRTTYMDTGEEFLDLGLEKYYEAGKTDFIFPDDLLSDEALTFALYPAFDPAELNNQAPNKGVVRVSPQVFSQSGSYVELGAAFGSWIYPIDDRGWIVPQPGLDAVALRRSGMVRSGLGARSFFQEGPSPLLDLQAEQAGQLIVINGNGAVYRVNTVRAGETLRAIVDTTIGTSTASPWSSAFPVSGSQGIRITCTYPSNGTTAMIRSDYPDAIAGLSGKAELNAPFVTIYVRSGSTIKRFIGLAVVDGTTQVFDLSDWAAGETISSIPAAPSATFSLFAALSASGVAQGGGNFPAGDIEVSYAFEYDGSTLTAISHDPNQGCIHVSGLTIAEMERSDRAWAYTVAKTTIRDLPAHQLHPWQTRRLQETGQKAVYNAASFATDNNSTIFKPAGKANDEPGRWHVEEDDILTQILIYGGN